MEYKKGKENIVADGLSRKGNENEGVECTAITIVEPSWLRGVQEMVSNSKFFQDLRQKFEQGKLSTERYSMINGVWYYKRRVLLDPISPVCKFLMLTTVHLKRGTLDTIKLSRG